MTLQVGDLLGARLREIHRDLKRTLNRVDYVLTSLLPVPAADQFVVEAG